MKNIKEISTRRGVIFFSILFIIQLCFQSYGFFKGKDFDFLLILFSFLLIIICKFYFKVDAFIKKSINNKHLNFI